MKRGVLLFAHGARDPQWADPFNRIAGQVRAGAPDATVVLAYLEFMSPNLLIAGDQLVDAGCSRVDVVPLFLGAGGHVRRDIPQLLERLEAAHPEVHWRLRPAIGELPDVIGAMAAAALAFVDDDAPTTA